MEHDVVVGLWILGLAAVACGLGYGVKTQANMLQLQAEMLRCLGELTQVIMQSGVAQQMMGAQNWRDLPPEGRAVFRKALREVLAEMDREIN